MVVIDWNSVKKQVEFTIKHHGTRTQGEEYRLTQVANCVTETVIQLFNAYSAASTMEDCDTVIKIGL